MDKLERIRYLLQAYYAGDSSLEEEKELEQFFASTAVPEEFEEDREMFNALSGIQETVEVPADLDINLEKLIDQAEQKEKRVKRLNLYSFSGLAAGLLIILSVYLGFIRQNQPSYMTRYAIEDEELAYKEARKALELVSEKWNTGVGELQELDKVNETFEQVSRPINKISSGTKELRLLGKLDKAKGIQIQ